MLSAEGMTDEEVEKNIIKHWHDWNKPKNQLEETKKQNKREKLLEFRKAKTEAKKQEKKLLQENRTVFPKGFWKEPTALIPKDKSEFPDFPNIDGLPKEEADKSIIEFWKKMKEKNYGYLVLKQDRKVLPTAQKKTKDDFVVDDEGNVIYRSIDLSKSRTRRQQLALGIEVLSKAQKRKQNKQIKKEAAEKNNLDEEVCSDSGSECEVPEDEETLMTMFEPPEDIATYPGYPNIGI